MTAQDVSACLSGELTLLNHMVEAVHDLSVDLLHPDYSEFGWSGRTYDFQDCLALIASDVVTDIDVEGMSAAQLGDDVVLLTYESQRDGRRAHRSSVWVRCPDRRWRLRHHQSTVVADA